MTANDTTAPPRHDQATSLSGTWRNGLGSEMDLHVTGGRLFGRYRTGVGTPRTDLTFELTGYVVGDALGFCVDFRPHGSVACWAGHRTRDVGGDGERLVTLWHLAGPVERPHGAPDLWRGTLSGADEFRRVD